MSKGKKNWISKLPSAYSKLPHSVSRSAFLNSYEKNIWCYLSTHTDRFHPSEALIARHTGITAKAVRNIIDRLIKKNVIEITNLPRSAGKKKEYRLIEPESWSTEQVPKTSFVYKEQAPKTCLNDSKQVLRTAYPRSLEPVIVDQKKNNIIEEQQVDSGEVNREEDKFKKGALKILKSKDHLKILRDLPELIQEYTSSNGESLQELEWLLEEIAIKYDEMELPSRAREKLYLWVNEANDSGKSKYQNGLYQD